MVPNVLLNVARIFPILLLLTAANAGNPFSSNVIALSSKNWREEVEDSPHAVFVNICRQGWGYCQLLTPEWEKLASGTKGTVKIAYWDSEQRSRRPTLLGEFSGTPTIRLFKPKKKQGNSNKKKDVVDYQYERKAKDMKRFLDGHQPNFIEYVNGSKALESFEEKSARNGLPSALLFTSKAQTSSLTKFLSTEFRRKLLLAEIYPNKNNKDIMEKYGITDLPALIVIPAKEDGETVEPIRYNKDDFTRIKLQNFLSKYALKEAIVVKKRVEKEQSKTEPKVEL